MVITRINKEGVSHWMCHFSAWCGCVVLWRNRLGLKNRKQEVPEGQAGKWMASKSPLAKVL